MEEGCLGEPDKTTKEEEKEGQIKQSADIEDVPIRDLDGEVREE